MARVHRTRDASGAFTNVTARGGPFPSLLELEREEDGPTLGLGGVAAVLGLSPDTAKKVLEAGDLRCFTLGRNRKVLWRSLRDYLFRSGALPLRPSERRRIRVVTGGSSVNDIQPSA